MRPTTAASTIRALIAAVPEERLRELIVELILTALRCLAASPGSSEPAVPTGNGRRRHWLSARRAAENAKRRERRLTNADGAPKRRGRRPKANADAPGNGSEPTANGRSGISPEANGSTPPSSSRRLRGAPSLASLGSLRPLPKRRNAIRSCLAPPALPPAS